MTAPLRMSFDVACSAGHAFTVFRDGHLFVNSGAAITGATALICCTR